MRDGIPSKTSMYTALYRAIHQQIDNGSVFKDPIAKKIIGIPEFFIMFLGKFVLKNKRLRYIFSARSAFSEEYLDDAVFKRRVSQVVLLGAGLDTLPYRNKYGNDISYFEIDHGSTQEWKIEKLRSSNISIPDNVYYASCDFETMNLLEALQSVGFEKGKRSYFIMLGTVQYLTDQASLSILNLISSLEGGAEIAFDYSEPRYYPGIEDDLISISKTGRTKRNEDETYVSSLTKEYLHKKMNEIGLDIVCDFDQVELLEGFMAKEEVNMLMSQKYPHDIDGWRFCFSMKGAV